MPHDAVIAQHIPSAVPMTATERSYHGYTLVGYDVDGEADEVHRRVCPPSSPISVVPGSTVVDIGTGTDTHPRSGDDA